MADDRDTPGPKGSFKVKIKDDNGNLLGYVGMLDGGSWGVIIEESLATRFENHDTTGREPRTLWKVVSGGDVGKFLGANTNDRVCLYPDEDNSAVWSMTSASRLQYDWGQFTWELARVGGSGLDRSDLYVRDENGRRLVHVDILT